MAPLIHEVFMLRPLRIPALFAVLAGTSGLGAQTLPAPQAASTQTILLSNKPLWSHKETGAAPAVALSEEALYLRQGGAVKRRNLADGHEVWSVTTDGFPLGEADGLAFLLNEKYELSCLDALTGREAWRVAVPKEGEVSFGHGNLVVVQGGLKGPLVVGDKVLVGTFGGALFKGRTGKLYAYDRKDGKLLWSFEAEDGLEQAPVVYKDMALFGGVAACYGVDLSTGRQVWKAETRNDNQWLFKVVGDTLLMSSGHYGAQKSSFGGTLYAFDAATGAQRWKYDIGGPSIIRVDGGRLVGLEWGMMGGSRLTCLDLATGKDVWQYKEKSSAWPVAVDGRAVYLDKENRIHLLNLATGKAEVVLPAAGDFRMGFFKGPWGRFMDPRLLQGHAVVGSWDKVKQETILQVLDMKQGKVAQEQRIAGEVVDMADRKDLLITLAKGAGASYTLQVFGR